MTHARRDFLKTAGALGALSATAALGGCAPSPLASAETAAAPPRTLGRGMARGLTLLTFRRNGEDRLGVKTDRGILDAAEAGRLLGLFAPATLDDLLQNEDGPSVEAVVKAALASGDAAAAFLAEEGLEYGPLVRRPDKIVCVGLNYRRHAEEMGVPVPEWPILFNKFNASLNRHGGEVHLPVDLGGEYDYEVELVIVMGREAHRISEADAASYIAGFATGNDFTSRDLANNRGGQWMIGKALDGFAPVGPYLVTADQVNGDDLAIECRVNGDTRQSSRTADLVFGTRALVSYISQYFTLKPGDLIFTGTPEGVIGGLPPDKRVWLKPGDRIECSIERLGELRFDLV
jgi:2-keto-4-pentenoate hydratase/2-oxohepta-3-ene-1,7-dioic acid hydratase in catechol pathway